MPPSLGLALRIGDNPRSNQTGTETVETIHKMRYSSKMLRPDSTRNSAFTLVELLVVITIIAIIAALLLTAFAHSKARALQIQCAGNLRQLGIALQEFKTDHHYYPPFLDPTIHSEGRNWMSALNDQMGEKNDFQTYHTGVWHCPAANRPADLSEHSDYYFYGYNSYGLGGFNLTNLSLGLSEHWSEGPAPKYEGFPTERVGESQIASPSEMIAMGDDFCGSPTFIVDGNFSFGRITDQQMSSWVPAGSSGTHFLVESTSRARHRHQDKANIVYCDGHVDSPTLKFLFEDTSDEALNSWNRDHLPHREKL